MTMYAESILGPRIRSKLYRCSARISYLTMCAYRYDRTAMDFGFLVMGSGFAYPLFLDIMRQCLNRAGPVPRADSAYTSASASIATSFLVHHIMAVADPHYRPPSSSSSSVCTRGSQPPCHPGHCTEDCDPLVPPLLHCHDSQQAVRGLVDLPGAHHSGPFVDPPAGLPMASHGTSYDAGLVGSRDVPPEGMMAKPRLCGDNPHDHVPKAVWC